MTTRNTERPAQSRARRLRFDRYILDLDRGCLILDGNELALRPKTFAVLQFLAENAGRLVSKEEIIATVWPNLVITDDALVQSVGELRRALGDDGALLIRTIPRRGYRFEPEVSVVPAAAQAPDTVQGPAVSYDGAAPTEPVAGVRATPAIFTMARFGGRSRLYLTLTLAILLAGGALWIGGRSEWKSLVVPELGDRSVTGKPAVAVLPLAMQGDESGRDYFADGLTQDIINALGRFSALTVISWNGVYPFKGKPATPEYIGRELTVAYLVEGSVRRVGDRVRVSAQLVDTRRARVLWSARFDEAMTDVFTLQDNMATQIVSALAIRMAQIEQRRVLAKPTESLQAYDYVLRARPASQRPTRANNAEARALLKRAIDLDPNYAAAYAALAETYHIGASMGWAESPTAYLSRAEELAGKALSLDPSEVRARVILARIHIFYQRYKQAEGEIRRAIAINPNDARSLAGLGNILVWLGQTDAAIEALEQAQRIDPDLNAIDRFALGLAYYLKRRYEAAGEQAEINLRGSERASFNRVILAAAYAQQDRTGEAARVVTDIRRFDPAFDPEEFGTKFLNTVDLEHLRTGLRKAGLYPAKPGADPAAGR